jgi:tRNA (cmo5U34)-methyltransferase
MEQSDNTTPYRASEYDRKVRQTIPFYEMFHAETVDLIRLVKPEAKTWLDTGCGTGWLVDMALPLFPNTIFMLADPSRSMLCKAKKRLQNKTSGRIEFLDCIGSENLPKNLSRRPDIITAIMCHHYLSPRKRADASSICFDLLNPGGIYVTFENIQPHCEKSVELGLERWRRFQVSQGRSANVVQKHLERFGKAYFPITVSEHLDLLHKCGFNVVELFWYSQMQAGFYAIK